MANLQIWPIWTDIEDPKTKGSDKGAKGGTGAHEDTETLDLPKNIQAICNEWKRPIEFVEMQVNKSIDEQDNTPVIVEDETASNLDIIVPNLHLFQKSELMRWIVCQICALWEVQAFITSSSTSGNAESSLWKPWDHIYPKIKGSNVPTVSSNCKYYIKLFWIGCWRKITIDDLLPITTEGSLLLPATSNYREQWLPLLSKAIIKVASLDYDSLHKREDFGEASIVHMLTGWLPLKLDITRLTDSEDMWLLLKRALPLWKRDSDSAFIEISEKSEEQPSLSELNNTPGKLENIPSDKEKFVKTKLTPASTQAVSKLGKPEKPKASSRIGQTLNKTSKGGINQSGQDEPDPIEQLREYAFLNPEGQPEHPTTVLLFGSFSYKKETLSPHDNKKNCETEVFFKDKKIPPTLSHSLLLKKIRDQPLKPPSPTPCFPKKEYPRYIGYRYRDSNPFDARKPPPTEPKVPRFIQFSSPLSNMLEQQPKGESSKAANVGLRKSGDRKMSLKKKSTSIQIYERENETPETNNSLLIEPNESLSQNHWIEFDDFLNIIDTLYIYYKPDVYPYKEKIESFLPQIRNRSASPRPQVERISSDTCSSTTTYLFVDSIRPIHIIFSLSTLVNWRHKSSGSLIVKKKTKIKIKYDGTSKDGLNSDYANPDSKSNTKPIRPYIEKEEVIYNPDGSLKVIPYEWRQVGEKIPEFILSTSAVNTFQLSLPRGRYIYKLSISASLGFVVNIFSHTKFCIGSEEAMMEKLVDYSASFNDLFTRLFNRLFDEIIPQFKDRKSKRFLEDNKDFEVLGENKSTLFQTIFDTLAQSFDKGEISNSIYFLCKKFVLSLFATLNPHTKIDTSKSYTKNTQIPERWLDHRPNDNEQIAATIIQSNFKRHRFHKNSSIFSLGSDEHSEVLSNLSKHKENYHHVWKSVLCSLLENDTQLCARLNLSLPHEMKIFYKDYSDKTKIELEKSDWCILFRDVFKLNAPNFILFHLVYNKDIGKGRLRVINNDTNKELTSVMGRIVPQMLLPNQFGYTVLGYLTNLTITETTSVEWMPWTLRVVGTSEILPISDSGNNINSNFTVTKEIDYYLPNNDYEMFRYLLTSTLDTIVTLYLTTSKNSAKFRITIEHQGNVIKEVIGYGNEVVPTLSLKFTKSEREEISHEDNDLDCIVDNTYVIICHVIENTWQFSESAWKNIDEIKAARRTIDDRRSVTPIGDGKTSKSVSKSKNVQSKTSKINHPARLNKEIYPHWKLYAAFNAEHEKFIKFVKDTRQEDELKTTKLGWEEMSQGRAEKAKKTRENFLESRRIDQDFITITPDEHEDLSRVQSAISNTGISIQPSESYIINPLQPLLSKAEFKQVDYSIYNIPATGPPKLLDEEENQRRQMQHDQECEQYRQWRVELLERRENERKLRNNLKDNQIKRLERLLVMSNQFHEKVFQPREALRQKYKPEKTPEEAENIPLSNTGRDSKKEKKTKGKK